MKRIFLTLLSVMMCTLLFVHAETEDQVFQLMDPYSLQYEEGQAYDASEHLTVWKNDTLLLKAVFHAKEGGILKLETEKSVTASFLKTVSASAGIGTDPAVPHENVPDMIAGSTIAAEAGETVYVLIEINVPENAEAGNKQTEVRLSEGSETYSLLIDYEVMDHVLPESTLSVEYWQYPYAALRWYDILEREKPFSKAHQSVLAKQLDTYNKLGIENITVTIVDEPWGHQVYDAYPSMVQWKHDKDGYLFFDYTVMDEWITLCMEHGIDGYIDCFGILPFTGKWNIYENDGTVTEVSPEIGSYEWTDLWSTFLYSFTEHMKEKGWLEKTYITIDERSVDDMKAAVSLVQEICGDQLKFHAALAEISEDEFYDVFDRLAVSVASFSGQEDMMCRIIAHRKELGLTTQMYNCSTNYPNVFALSDPDEALWTMEYLAGMGFDGYLRWALDAWTEDPYQNLDWDHFEAGDTMLVYPDEKTSKDPEVRLSYRLKLLEQGMRNVSKLQASGKDEILSVMYRGNGDDNGYGAVYAKNAGTSLLTEKETARVGQMIRCAEDPDAGLKEPDLSRHRSFLTYLGLNPSRDGIYLGLKKCVSIFNLTCLMLNLIILAVMFARHEVKIKKTAAGAVLFTAVCICAAYGKPVMLIDRLSILIFAVTLLNAVTAFSSLKRQGESE